MSKPFTTPGVEIISFNNIKSQFFAYYLLMVFFDDMITKCYNFSGLWVLHVFIITIKHLKLTF